MHFLLDNWVVVLVITLLLVFVLINRSKRVVTYYADINSIEELSMFLRTCSNEDALNRWSEVKSYVMSLDPSELAALETLLVNVTRDGGQAGLLLSFVQRESGQFRET